MQMALADIPMPLDSEETAQGFSEQLNPEGAIGRLAAPSLRTCKLYHSPVTHQEWLAFFSPLFPPSLLPSYFSPSFSFVETQSHHVAAPGCAQALNPPKYWDSRCVVPASSSCQTPSAVSSQD